MYLFNIIKINIDLTTVGLLFSVCMNFVLFLLQDPFSSNGASGSGLLTLVPSTMNRWTEEAKVLDGDSVHDCVTCMYYCYIFISNKEVEIDHLESCIFFCTVFVKNDIRSRSS